MHLVRQNTRLPNPAPAETPTKTPAELQPPRRTRREFRWELLLIPLLLLGVMWIFSGVDGAAISFDELIDLVGVRNREQYRQLATLGLIIVGALSILRIARKNRSHET